MTINFGFNVFSLTMILYIKKRMLTIFCRSTLVISFFYSGMLTFLPLGTVALFSSLLEKKFPKKTHDSIIHGDKYFYAFCCDRLVCFVPFPYHFRIFL